MSRTFTPLVGSPSSDPFLVGHKWGYQNAEIIRQALDQFAYLGAALDLGGSDDVGQLSASYVGVRGYRDYSLNGSNLGGLTTEAVVYYRTAAAGTSVTVRVRNTTAPSTAGTGTTSTSTTLVREVITLTIATGAEAWHRLEVIGGNATAAVYAYGYLRFRAIPT